MGWQEGQCVLVNGRRERKGIKRMHPPAAFGVNTNTNAVHALLTGWQAIGDVVPDGDGE